MGWDEMRVMISSIPTYLFSWLVGWLIDRRDEYIDDLMIDK